VLQTRRQLIAAATAVAGTAAVPPAWAQRILSATPRLGPGTFRDGVASGDPAPTEVTFWGRLTTDRPRSGARLVVARDAGLQQVVAQTVVATGAAIDHCLKARVGGLAPAETYFYAWESGDDVSPVGRTRTANPADSRAPVRIAVSSCQNYDEGYFTGHSHAAAQPPYDLVLFTGDYIYETDGGAGTDRADPIDSNDLQSYRDKYRLYRSDVGLRELHRLHPCAHVWDDHEVANNYTDNAPAPSPLQRTMAYRVAFEWLPRLTFPEERFRIYKPLPLGRDVEVLTLDERQYRSGPGANDPDAPVEFLGRTQLDWLKDRLAQAQARGTTWKVLANQHPVFPIRPVESQQSDEWQGFQRERTELLTFIRDRGITGVVFVTGDIHVFIASELSPAFDQADHAPGPTNRSVAVDYVCGSITSDGDVLGYPADEALEPGVIANNPHIKQFDNTKRGYGSLDLTQERLVTEYRSGPIDRPDAQYRVIERFTQQAGQATFTRESNPVPRAAERRAAATAARAAGAAERRAAARSRTARRRRRRIARRRAATG